jgi:hypothetical protein
VTTYCQNRLTVSGPGEELQSFVERVQTEEQPLSFETLAPTPAELLKHGWYEWRIEHWGTKWDAEFEDVTEPLRVRRTRATYVFLTAWAPPVEWLQPASEAYPDLTFRLDYVDQGGSYSGVREVKSGEVVEARSEARAPYGVHS